MSTAAVPPNSVPRAWLTRGVLGIGLASLFSDWGHEIATALLPVLLAGLGAPAYALGLIEGIADGLSSFSKLAGGWLADRPALRKPIAAGGYLVVGLATFGFGFVGSWASVLVLRAAGWMGRGAKNPSRDALLADAVPATHLGRAFGFERAMDTAGAVIGPLCATALVATMSVPAAMRWTLLPGVLAAAVFALLVPAGKRALDGPARSFLSSLRQLPPPFRRFLVGVFVFGLGDFAHTLLIFRAGQILLPRYGTLRAAALAVGLYTFHNLLYALASYPAGALGDRFSKRSVLAAGYALAALMSLGFLFAPSSVPALAALFGIAGIYIATEEALEKSLAAELLPIELRGSGFGVMATVNGVGDFVSSILVGLLWSAVAPAAGFLYAAVLSVAGAVLIFRLR